MADKDAELIVQISATTELLRQQVAKADSIVNDFQRNTNSRLAKVDKDFAGAGKSVNRLQTSFKSLAAVGVASLGATFSAGIISNFARNALETGSALSELSEKLGVSVEDLQKFTFLGGQAGIEAEQMQKSLQKLTRSVGEAAAGNKKAAGAFNELGLNIRNADGSLKSAGTLFGEIAGGLAKIPDPASRARLEVALFGKAGQDLAPLLNQGADGIAKLSKEYDKLGIALSGDQAKRLDDAADAYEKFKTKLEGKFTIWFAEYGIPEIEAFARNTEKEFNKIGALFDWMQGKAAKQTPVRIPAASFQATSAASNAGALNGFSPYGPKPLYKKPFSLSRNFLPTDSQGLGTFGGYGSASTGPAISGPLDGFSETLDATIATLDERIADYSNTARDNFAASWNEVLDLIDEKSAKGFYAAEKEANLRENSIRAQADIYETLMTRGTKEFLRTLESEGLRIVAEMAARLIAGQSLGVAFKGAAGNSTIGAALGLASSFGGFFAGGGSPPMGKVSVVGERGPELFVPKVPGTIIPNGGFGGNSTHLNVYAPGATAETVMMIRRELANAAPHIVAAATQSTVKTLTRPRI